LANGPPEDAGPPDRVLDRLPTQAKNVVKGTRFRLRVRDRNPEAADPYRTVTMEVIDVQTANGMIIQSQSRP
jgi:hypothetical protein